MSMPSSLLTVDEDTDFVPVNESSFIGDDTGNGIDAEESDLEDPFVLGVKYQFGVGVLKNDDEASRCYLIAAEQGNPQAQFTVGMRYTCGMGLAENQQEAVRWYRSAAEQGHAGAGFILGSRYENGFGVEKDLEQAIQWYRMAADQDDADAQFCLGKCYECGAGVIRNRDEALAWFRKAAKNGNAKAQSRVDRQMSDARSVKSRNQLKASATSRPGKIENDPGTPHWGLARMLLRSLGMASRLF